jgi:hypothetical protein
LYTPYFAFCSFDFVEDDICIKLSFSEWEMYSPEQLIYR